MIPGDQWVDPIIKRGEDLERIDYRVRSLAEGLELESIKAYAKSKLAHLAAYPLANNSAEESAQDLAQEKERDAASILEAVVDFIDRHGAEAAELVLTLAAGALKR